MRTLTITIQVLRNSKPVKKLIRRENKRVVKKTNFRTTSLLDKAGEKNEANDRIEFSF